MATPKLKLEKKMRCIGVTVQIGRCSVVFGEDAKKGESNSAAAQNAINYGLADPKEAQAFQVDKVYTITITE